MTHSFCSGIMFPLRLRQIFASSGTYRLQGFMLSRFPIVLLLLWLFCPKWTVNAQPAVWWKGNLHTHTLWSDGDDYPEMVVEWYKTNGYHFLVLSDHNITQQGDKWIGLGTNKTAAIALNKYLERYPNVINRIRSTNGTEMIRLKTLQEFRGAFEELDHFLLMMGEEISAKAGKIPVHIGAVNI